MSDPMRVILWRVICDAGVLIAGFWNVALRPRNAQVIDRILCGTALIGLCLIGVSALGLCIAAVAESVGEYARPMFCALLVGLVLVVASIANILRLGRIAQERYLRQLTSGDPSA